ncbi:MAG: DUF1127 domain-containing protein [Dongiaceae bacterium]
MTRFTEVEKAMVGQANTLAPHATGFVGALVARFRHAAVRRQVAHELSELSDRTLADIGIVRADIDRVATVTADQAVPTGGSLGLGAFLGTALVRPVVRYIRRRRAYDNLMALDDRMLNDIGISRDEIPALVRSLTGARPAWATAAGRPIAQDGTGTLAEMGFARGDTSRVAEELAVRSLNSAANANSRAPRAA